LSIIWIYKYLENNVLEIRPVTGLKGLNRAGVCLPSPEDGDRSRFRNFSSYFGFRKMDKVQKTSNSDQHIEIEEARFLKYNFVLPDHRHLCRNGLVS
jgi:hypothetical protein